MMYARIVNGFVAEVYNSTCETTGKDLPPAEMFGDAWGAQFVPCPDDTKPNDAWPDEAAPRKTKSKG